MRFQSKKGFSTIIAILLTAFLVVLTSGVLFLFLSENRINQTLFNGISTYIASEGGMELALLKIRNHESGFQDELNLSDAEASAFVSASNPRAATFGYKIEANGSEYSGSIAPNGFEIIPLFVDNGRAISNSQPYWKDFSTKTVTRTRDFLVQPEGDIVWNLLGSDGSGTTFGLVGTGSTMSFFGNASEAQVKSGLMKIMTTDRDAAQGTVSINTLLGPPPSLDLQYPYLVLFNPSTTATVKYSIKSPSSEFSFPLMRVVSHGKLRNSLTNLEFKEDHSRLFDVLKYSLYNTAANNP